MRKVLVSLLVFILAFSICSCSSKNTASNSTANQTPSTTITPSGNTKNDPTTTSEEDETVNTTLVLKIDNVEVDVFWADNESVKELKKLAKDGLTINMHMYSTFEQVGSLGQTIKSSDSSYTATAGDICLYQSNQIVLFYGSNTYEYTK